MPRRNRYRGGVEQGASRRELTGSSPEAFTGMLLMGYIRESGRLPYLVRGRVRPDGPMALPPKPLETAPGAPAPDGAGGSP